MKKKVILVGGGFGGINLIRHLDPKMFDVLLIDKLNHHQFQPLFYQVATSQIEPSSISFPFRYVFRRQKNLQIRLAEVLSVQPKINRVETNIGNFEYDYLVLANGCKTNFFGNANIERNAFTLKTTYEAIEIRNHITRNFERILSSDESDKSALLNLVIVGAGPTGVELAGAFAELKRDVLPKDYPGIDFSSFSVFLIEGSKNTLNTMSENARIASKNYLQKLGVQIITETFVQDYDGETVVLSNGLKLQSSTVIWSAGVIGNKIKGLDDHSWTPTNRLIVDRFNKVKGYENIFAIGDIAMMTTPKYEKGHPQLANVAINQGKLLAKNLKRALMSKPLIEYEYTDLGSMATIGKNKAVVDLPYLKMKGLVAWLVWMFLHLMLILSVKNKLIIFINWAWNYISGDSSLRLILTPSKKRELKG
jgi:NADH dehydrogenase